MMVVTLQYGIFGILIALAATVVLAHSAKAQGFDLLSTASSDALTVAETTAPFTQAVTETITPVAPPATETASSATQPVANGMAAISQPIVETTSSVVEPVTQTVSTGSEPRVGAVAPIAEPVVKDIAPIAQPVVNTVSTVTDPFLTGIDPIPQPIQEVVTPVVSIVTDVLAPATSDQPSSQPQPAPTGDGPAAPDAPTTRTWTPFEVRSWISLAASATVLADMMSGTEPAEFGAGPQIMAAPDPPETRPVAPFGGTLAPLNPGTGTSSVASSTSLGVPVAAFLIVLAALMLAVWRGQQQRALTIPSGITQSIPTPPG